MKNILSPLGFELVELKSMKSDRGLVLRLLIDRTEGGITLGECSQLNRQIGQVIDEKNLLSDRYILEVSSPGLDRPLVEPRDFRRNLDKIIHIFLREAKNGKLELEGKLIKLDTEGISIVDDKNQEQSVYFKEIVKAKKVIL